MPGVVSFRLECPGGNRCCPWKQEVLLGSQIQSQAPNNHFLASCRNFLQLTVLLIPCMIPTVIRDGMTIMNHMNLLAVFGQIGILDTLASPHLISRLNRSNQHTRALRMPRVPRMMHRSTLIQNACLCWLFSGCWNLKRLWKL